MAKSPKLRYQIYEDHYLYTTEYWLEKSVRLFGFHLWWKRIAYYATRKEAEQALTRLNS